MNKTPEFRESTDSISLLGELLRDAGLTLCFWDGAPPCPKCGGDHGFPADKTETRYHRQLRFAHANQAAVKRPRVWRQMILEAGQ